MKYTTEFNGKKHLIRLTLNGTKHLLNFDTQEQVNECIKDLKSNKQYYITDDRDNGYIYVKNKKSGWSGALNVHYSNNKKDSKLFECRKLAYNYIKHHRGNFEIKSI